MNVTAAVSNVRTPKPAGPAEGTVIANLVIDGMPGEGVNVVAKGARLAPETTWTNLADAEAAVRQLTFSDDVPAAGIFRRDGRYEAYTLNSAYEGSTRFQPYHAWSDSYMARTVAGRGLVTIVDGSSTPDLMSEKEFRTYRRWAD